MEKTYFNAAFDEIKVSDAVVDELIAKSFSPATAKARSSRPPMRVLMAAAAMVMLLAVSVTAVTAKLVTGSFVGFFADIEGNEAVVEAALNEVGDTVVDNNLAVTLESVVADEYAIYIQYSIETTDGSAIFNVDTPQTKQLWTTFPGVTFPESDGRAFQGNGIRIERIDDYSDPTSAKFAIALSFYRPVNFGKTIIELGNIFYNHPYEDEMVTEPIASGHWSFTVDIENKMPAKKYSFVHDDKTYIITATYSSIFINSKTEDSFVRDFFRQTFSVHLDDGSIIGSTHGGMSVGNNSNNYDTEGKGTAIYGDTEISVVQELDKMTDPSTITAIQVGDDIYPLTAVESE